MLEWWSLRSCADSFDCNCAMLTAVDVYCSITKKYNCIRYNNELICENCAKNIKV